MEDLYSHIVLDNMMGNMQAVKHFLIHTLLLWIFYTLADMQIPKA